MTRKDSQQNNLTLEIYKDLSERIEKASFGENIQCTGKVTFVGDGVVTASGLSEAMVSEIVELPGNNQGLVLGLRESEVSVAILGDDEIINEGDQIKTTGKILAVPVSNKLIGRVVDPMLKPIDGGGAIETIDETKMMDIEKVAPGIIQRQDVRTPLQTGLKIVDALIPIGRGQRELIIGDRGTGKTAIAIDAIINQEKINEMIREGEKRVICIYVAIGQKQAKVAQVVSKLAEKTGLKSTIVVSATAADSATKQYLAPFSATAIAEYFMDRGEDVLIVYDDLSKHAWAYRELSLLLRKPSGREAYPGDIFYLHSRLLERAARMNDKAGGGSITALPIIETQAGDISAYIPTNVISITDGQIFLDQDIFHSGIKPAISVGLSVSRVGGDAQLKSMKQVAGKLKLDLAQYRELAAFAQFGSDLDEDTRKRLDRGRAITQLLVQEQYMPVPVEEQISGIWLGMKGYLDDLKIERIGEFEEMFIDKLRSDKHKPLEKVRKEKVIKEDSERIMLQCAEEIKILFSQENKL